MIECNHPPHRLYAWYDNGGKLVVCCCECGAVLKGAAEYPQAHVQSLSAAEKGVARKRAKVDANMDLANEEARKRGHDLIWERSARAFTQCGYCSCGALAYADTREVRGTAINSLTHDEMIEVGKRILREMKVLS